MKPSVLEIAKRTIDIEARSVQELNKVLDQGFEKAIQLIQDSTGRLVVSGIGKSAIIGQKIVATLNSTGTPALFMHAADAIHGDLGMIQKDDVVMVISKSGESPEIKVLVPFIRNLGNPIIGMVGNTNSFLAKSADTILNTYVETEACPNDLAPTSSTTAQMVMGDSLAVCLMELRGFTAVDFAKYHPGGNLGKRLYLKVGDVYIHNERPGVKKEDTLRQVIISISAGRMGATVVMNDQEKVEGVITDGDIRRLLEKQEDLTGLTAADIYTPDPRTVRPDDLAAGAYEILAKNDISQLIVSDIDGRYLGMLHLHDLIKEGFI